MINVNVKSWLDRRRLREASGDQPAGGPPMDVPPAGGGPGGIPGMGMGSDPNVANPPPDQMGGQLDAGGQPGQMPDVTMDPQAPDMPQENDDMDFEQWKDAFFKESVKGDVPKLLDLIHQVRDLDLDAYPRKFVEDNLQVIFLRQNANIDKAGKEIRKLIKQEMDQNNPATSVVNHMDTVLQQMPELNNVQIKLKGLLGMKSDLHRKYIASLLGAVQVGSGADKEDIIYNEKEYSIRISTRYVDKWGRVDIGDWNLKEDDPDRYLSEPEIRRLEEGSPEEKEVLRRRIVMESISDTFQRRAFIVNNVSKDGTIYTLGWDLSGSLRAAYTDGKLVVRTVQSENSEAMIDDDGAIVPFVDLKIKYMRDTGQVDADGKPAKEEHDFLERIDGMLFLTAQFQILKEAASSFQGIVLKETPYSGNPSDLRVLQRCVPSATEILMRQC